MNVRLILIAWLPLVAVSQMGCIALNVPSQRYHDPTDGGGLLGPWSSHGGVHCQQPNCVADLEKNCGLAGGALEADPFDTAVDASGKPKPPEVPWPRFHPVPTRPVFGLNSP